VRPLFAVALVALLGTGCKEKELPKEGLGQDTADITSDTSVLREAQGAVNEVLRNAADCELAKPHIATATVKLDDAEKNLRTVSGRTTLEALRKQLRTVAENCP
jgi:hypothetical protein